MRFLILAAALTALLANADARQPAQAPPRVQGAPKLSPTRTHSGHLDHRRTGDRRQGGVRQELPGNTITFGKVKGADTATLRERNFDPIEFAYRLDPAATPRAVDLTLPTRGVTFRGIYKLDGDDLTICMSNGGSRPTDFATKAPDIETFTLKRGHWERYVDRDYGFNVEMPGKPEERRRDIETPAGKLAGLVLVVPSEMEHVTYVLVAARLPNKPDAKDVDALLAAAKTAALAEVYPTATTSQEEKKPKPKMAGATPQELTLTLDLPGSKDRAAARARLFVAGDRLYVLMVAGSEEGTKSPNVLQFWNAFRQPADKKGKN